MRSLISRGSGLPWAFSSRDSLLVEIISSSATSFRFFPESSRSRFRAAAMPRRGPSGPVTLSKVGSLPRRLAVRSRRLGGPRRRRTAPPSARAAPCGRCHGGAGTRQVIALPFPSWESHSATVLPAGTYCTVRHSGIGATAHLQAADDHDPGWRLVTAPRDTTGRRTAGYGGPAPCHGTAGHDEPAHRRTRRAGAPPDTSAAPCHRAARHNGRRPVTALPDVIGSL